ncbi:hypothetical protein D3C80_2024390 [compost metagenome]
MITNNGIIVTPASILGMIRYPGELTPITSKASICSVTRIVPICDAMFEPVFPARTSAPIVGLNSRIELSRVICPITDGEIRLLTN